MSELLLGAMAARSLDDRDLAWQSSLAFTLVAVPLAVGLWGIIADRLKQRRATPAAA